MEKFENLLHANIVLGQKAAHRLRCAGIAKASAGIIGTLSFLGYETTGKPFDKLKVSFLVRFEMNKYHDLGEPLIRAAIEDMFSENCLSFRAKDEQRFYAEATVANAPIRDVKKFLRAKAGLITKKIVETHLLSLCEENPCEHEEEGMF